MDFYRIKERVTKTGTEIYPDFRVCRSQDLMVRGKSFYAIWDEKKGLWSTDEYDVQRLVDEDLLNYRDKIDGSNNPHISVRMMGDFSSKSWLEFRSYLNHLSDCYVQLDENITFSNTEVKKKDYISRRLDYPLEPGPIEAYDELIGTLYDPDERAKIEWAIGAVIAGDAKHIQKFLVLYGEAGAGKSTILNIIQKLFKGYYTAFEARALASSNNAFSTEVFRSNPLVAIQHDGDLSKIEDNTKLNSLISHEEMALNEKFKPAYMSRINSFLFMATNKPVKITDAKSGIIRRLIDVSPSGRRLPLKKYHTLMMQVDFELGAIASRCLEVYRQMGKDYYSDYQPLEMMLQTDVFYNFIEMNFDIFKEQDGVSLSQAYTMYKTYCDEALIDFKLPRHKFRDELRNYFRLFHDMKRVDGKQIRSFYEGFITTKFTAFKPRSNDHPYSLVLDHVDSIFDEMAQDYKAQYAGPNDIPTAKWSEVTTTLGELDTSKVHYVMVPENHIVVDFDIVDENGDKSAEANLEAASEWPSTYSEFSKSGNGVHLHYIYDGDVSRLSRFYDDGIEIKIFSGNSSLRRRLTRCNNIPIATISSGLPLKEEKVIDLKTVKSEQALRALIKRNLNKEIHPGTKPSIDFIYKILDDAYSSGLAYDVSDMRGAVLGFASGSTNQSAYCVKLVARMKFKSEEASEAVTTYDNNSLAYFDVEVFPNLFLISWKYEGPDAKCVRMINPTPQEIEELLRLKLVGFNCRKYDNHILYGRYIGYNNEQLYKLSQRIIANDRDALFQEAYSISYADVYDYSNLKQGLKRFQIDLGIHHQELGFPWDEPVPEEKWGLVGEYCDNDVIATEAVANSRREDFVARQILSELSGLTVNDTTQRHTARIVFGTDRNPQSKFIYTDLSEEFPGYKYEGGVSTYRGEEVGEGGFVYAEPGIYYDVSLLDVASMHPTSIEVLNLFGPYTKNYSDLKNARLAIKHGDISAAAKMLDGKLKPYLNGDLKALSYALKIALNIVYGLTSASFDNPFRDIRNKDNIVAKRGALFMIDLKHFIQKQGYSVVHIKTDSVKVPGASAELINNIFEFGNNYGYTFEHESTYDRMCLVNDAVYIAYDNGEWSATGAQFAHPYVFKKLFSKEAIEFDDLCETKTVKTALYLDMNENLEEDEHNYIFVGRAGRFTPVIDGVNGGILLRKSDDKYYSAAGAKGYRWLESEIVDSITGPEIVDYTYFNKLADDAVDKISQFGDFDQFIFTERRGNV